MKNLCCKIFQIRNIGFVVFLLLCLFFTDYFTSFADGSGDNITDKFVIKMEKLSYEKGGVEYDLISNPNPAVKLQVGDTLKVIYNWSITEENAKYVKDNSYFLIKLPDQEVLKYFGASESDLLIYDNTLAKNVSFGKTVVAEVGGGEGHKGYL